jgi:ketosteroid isomerase-like protein
MSEENIEIVRRLSADLKAEPERASPLWAPDAVWDMSTVSEWPDRAEYRGWDEFLEFLYAWTAAYDEWSYELETVTDAGDNKVVATLSQRGKLRGSESWAELRYGIVYTVESAIVQRAQVYIPAEKALEAAGLSE